MGGSFRTFTPGPYGCLVTCDKLTTPVCYKQNLLDAGLSGRPSGLQYVLGYTQSSPCGIS